MTMMTMMITLMSLVFGVVKSTITNRVQTSNSVMVKPQVMSWGLGDWIHNMTLPKYTEEEDRG